MGERQPAEDRAEGGHVGLFVWEALGGAAFGLAAGWGVYRMLRRVDDYQVEILLTVALAAGGFALADRLHLSGAAAMIAAGLLIGSRARPASRSGGDGGRAGCAAPGGGRSGRITDG